MDRIDVVVDVPRPETDKVIAGKQGTSSEQMAERVAAAREFRRWREEVEGEPALRPPAADLSPAARATFESLARGLSLGGRGIVRVTRVARTIADLEQHERISEDDVVEALGFRPRARG